MDSSGFLIRGFGVRVLGCGELLIKALTWGTSERWVHAEPGTAASDTRR